MPIGKCWTEADIGYSDPELIRQLNLSIEGCGANPLVNAYGQPAQLGSYYTLPTFPGSGPGSQNVTGGPPSSGQTIDYTLGGGSQGPGTLGGLDPCQYAPGGAVGQAACRWLAGQVANRLGTTNAAGGTCPTGYEPNPKAGQPGESACRIKGMGSYLPGDIGNPDLIWTPIGGRYGAGVTPVMVQRNVRACPAGYVLGKDGICYDHLARTNRAHNPGAKPLLTGGDMNALRRARQLQKTIGKMNRRFGPKPRVPRGAPRRKR